MCTTGTVRHEAEVQSKSQREKLFSYMSSAPFAKKKDTQNDPPPSPASERATRACGAVPGVVSIPPTSHIPHPTSRTRARPQTTQRCGLAPSGLGFSNGTARHRQLIRSGLPVYFTVQIHFGLDGSETEGTTAGERGGGGGSEGPKGGHRGVRCGPQRRDTTARRARDDV